MKTNKSLSAQDMKLLSSKACVEGSCLQYYYDFSDPSDGWIQLSEISREKIMGLFKCGYTFYGKQSSNLP